MKNLFYALCFLALMTTTLSCSSGKSPGDVAVTFMESLENGEFDKAKEYSTEETKQIINAVESIFKEQKKNSTQEDKTYCEVIDTKIDGDKAVCKLKMTNGEGKSSETTVDLVKKKGKWLVDLNKEDMDKENMPPMN